jgi:hypothetical protein
MVHAYAEGQHVEQPASVPFVETVSESAEEPSLRATL